MLRYNKRYYKRDDIINERARRRVPAPGRATSARGSFQKKKKKNTHIIQWNIIKSRVWKHFGKRKIRVQTLCIYMYIYNNRIYYIFIHRRPRIQDLLLIRYYSYIAVSTYTGRLWYIGVFPKPFSPRLAQYPVPSASSPGLVVPHAGDSTLLHNGWVVTDNLYRIILFLSLNFVKFPISTHTA